MDTTSIQSNNTLGTVIEYKTNSLAVNDNGVAVTSSTTINSCTVLTTDTSYTKTQIDTTIANAFEISATADVTVGGPSQQHQRMV